MPATSPTLTILLVLFLSYCRAASCPRHRSRQSFFSTCSNALSLPCATLTSSWMLPCMPLAPCPLYSSLSRSLALSRSLSLALSRSLSLSVALSVALSRSRSLPLSPKWIPKWMRLLCAPIAFGFSVSLSLPRRGRGLLTNAVSTLSTRVMQTT